jgi:hypothetical protein
MRFSQRHGMGKPDVDKEQHKRFLETARQLECDEDKERFEEKLGKIAKAKPAAAPPASAKKRQ